MNLYNKVQEACAFLTSKGVKSPDFALVLGSGLGDLCQGLEKTITIPYEKIPYFQESKVAGHKGQMVFGTMKGKTCLVMQGRLHYYEGLALSDVTLPIRVMASLKAKRLILTNASGGIAPRFAAGDLVLISDHINLSGLDPLRGPHDERLGARFVDVSQVYDKAMSGCAQKIAQKQKINLKQGIYGFLPGPSYETAAEVKMLQTLGIDMVGMSTVPEVIVAAQYHLPVLGISCVTNMAGGLDGNKVTHEEVEVVAQKVIPAFKKLIFGVIETF